MPQRCMCPNFNWEYRMIAALQRRKLHMFKWREGMLAPRAFVRGNPTRVTFAAENTCQNDNNNYNHYNYVLLILFYDIIIIIIVIIIILIIFLSRKSKDYVYGLWVYKVLVVWKVYYRVKRSLVSYAHHHHFYPRPVLAIRYCQGNLPNFELVRHNLLPIQGRLSQNLDHRCKIVWLRSLLFWVAIDLDLQLGSNLT